MKPSKVITVEEHFLTREIAAAWSACPPEAYDPDMHKINGGPMADRLLDLGDQRLEWMDRMGVDVQVLSMTTPGVQVLEPAAAVTLAAQSNDLIAATVRAHPDRFAGLATLPTPDPKAAAAELRRAVGELGLHGGFTAGRTGDRNLDHPDNEPIFAAAAELRAPLFVHPQIAHPAVRKALYSDLPGAYDLLMSTAGVGWFYEAGVQAIRLILSGVFDRYPDLTIILGHWGDLVAFYLDELEMLAKVARGEFEAMPRFDGAPERTITEYFRSNIYITSSGTLSSRYLRWSTEVLGADRILLSLDYPAQPRKPGDVERYLDQAPLNEDDAVKLASGNWEAMMARIVRPAPDNHNLEAAS